MKKYICISFVSVLLLSLILPVSAQTLEHSDDFLDYLNSRVQEQDDLVEYYCRYELLMNDFILSDTPEEILLNLIADETLLPEYTLTSKEIAYDGETVKYSTLFGVNIILSGSTKDTDNHLDNYTVKTLSSESIEIECILEFSLNGIQNNKLLHYSCNSVVVKKEAFDLLNDELREYLSAFDNVQKFYEFDGLEVPEEGYTTWNCKVVSDGDIESGAEYWLATQEEFHLWSVYANSYKSVRFITEYLKTWPYWYGGSLACTCYYMTLIYSEPENEADKGDYSKYELESVMFYAPDVGAFKDSTSATSPQTGSSAALPTFLAVVSLGVICCVRKVRV
ncbi:MAG: hypothetical protein LUI01_05370 [Firmicutes bacterium]|nr:hypothetical protein [Bacillota bacterium]